MLRRFLLATAAASAALLAAVPALAQTSPAVVEAPRIREMPTVHRAGDLGHLRIHVVDRRGKRVTPSTLRVSRVDDLTGASEAVMWGGGRLRAGSYVVVAFEPGVGSAVARVEVRGGRTVALRLRLDPRRGAPAARAVQHEKAS